MSSSRFSEGSGRRSTSRRNTVFGGGLLALLGMTATATLALNAASCASNETVEETSDGAVLTVNDAGDASDASDGGCAAGDERCDPPQWLQCDEADWCPVETTQPKGKGLSSIWGSGPNDIWAVGAFGSAIHWDGATWTSMNLDTHWTLRTVWGTGPNDVWAAAASNQIFHYTGSPQWETIAPIPDSPTAPPTFINAVWGTSPSNVWVAGELVNVQRPENSYPEQIWRTSTSEGAFDWAPVMQDFNFQTVRGIWGTAADDVWVICSKWTPATPCVAHANGDPANEGTGSKFTEFDLGELAMPNAIWGSSTDDVWVVGDLGSIRHWTTETQAWNYVESPTYEHLRSIWGFGPNDIWVVGDHGLFMHWDGSTWKEATAGLRGGDKPTLYGVWGSSPSDVWAVGNGVVMHYVGPKAGAQGANP